MGAGIIYTPVDLSLKSVKEVGEKEQYRIQKKRGIVMLGTIVNVLTVLGGGTIGLFLKKGIREDISDMVMKGLALCTIYIGVSSALKGENTLITPAQKPVGVPPSICAIVAGNAMIDTAKMIGITPAIATLIGTWELCPPYIFLPTTLFAY